MSENSMGFNPPRFFGFGGGGGDKPPEKPKFRDQRLPPQPPRVSTGVSVGEGASVADTGISHGHESSGATGSSVAHTSLTDVARPAEQSPIPDGLSPAARALARCFVGSGTGMARTWADLADGLQNGIRSFSLSVTKAQTYSGIAESPTHSADRWNKVWDELQNIARQVEDKQDRWDLLRAMAITDPSLVSDMLAVRAMHLVLSDYQIQQMAVQNMSLTFNFEHWKGRNPVAYKELQEIGNFINSNPGIQGISLVKDALNGIPNSMGFWDLLRAIGFA